MNAPRLSLREVLAARQRIAPHLYPTLANNYPGLDRLLGCRVWIKHENHQPTGAFKVRGGVNLCAAMPEPERRPGIVAASTGNHGQSIAFAARLFGIPATIYVPEGANPDKVGAIENLGARIVYHGPNYEICRRQAEAFAGEIGARFVSGGNEPLLIAGVGTYALELFERVPDLDYLFVPVGGGSGACGCCIVGHAVRPGVKVVGVQSAHASSVYQSWHSKEWVTTESADTFAEGLATLAPFEVPLEILRRELDEFELVDDGELRRAIRMLFTHTHNIAEGAGAAAFAAAYRRRDALAGKNVGIILSGGNLTLQMLREICNSED